MVDSSGAEKGDFKLLKKSLKWTFNFRFKQDLYFILQRLSFQEEEATLIAVQANTDCKLVKKKQNVFTLNVQCTVYTLCFNETAPQTRFPVKDLQPT